MEQRPPSLAQALRGGPHPVQGPPAKTHRPRADTAPRCSCPRGVWTQTRCLCENVQAGRHGSGSLMHRPKNDLGISTALLSCLLFKPWTSACPPPATRRLSQPVKRVRRWGARGPVQDGGTAPAGPVHALCGSATLQGTWPGLPCRPSRTGCPVNTGKLELPEDRGEQGEG